MCAPFCRAAASYLLAEQAAGIAVQLDQLSSVCSAWLQWLADERPVDVPAAAVGACVSALTEVWFASSWTAQTPEAAKEASEEEVQSAAYAKLLATSETGPLNRFVLSGVQHPTEP